LCQIALGSLSTIPKFGCDPEYTPYRRMIATFLGTDCGQPLIIRLLPT
jgi:hypothetical protein